MPPALSRMFEPQPHALCHAVLREGNSLNLKLPTLPHHKISPVWCLKSRPCNVRSSRSYPDPDSSFRKPLAVVDAGSPGPLRPPSPLVFCTAPMQEPVQLDLQLDSCCFCSGRRESNLLPSRQLLTCPTGSCAFCPGSVVPEELRWSN